MPQLADDEKTVLLVQREEAEKAKFVWGSIFGSSPFLGAGTVLHSLPPPLGAFVTTAAALGGVVTAVLHFEEIGLKRALDDPPRRDFGTPTKAKSRRYRAGSLGQGDLAAAIDGAAITALRYSAYLEAMVRADERAQGAEAAGAARPALERAEEAAAFLERARVASLDQAEALADLSIIWARSGAKQSVGGGGAVNVETPPPDRDEALRRTRLVAPWRELARFSSAAFADENLDLDRLFLASASQTRDLSLSSLAVFADARADRALELAARRRGLAGAADAPLRIDREISELDRGLASWRQGDPAGALALLEPAAERIDVRNRERGRLEWASSLDDEPPELPPPARGLPERGRDPDQDD